jgi:hypothetical protein
VGGLFANFPIPCCLYHFLAGMRRDYGSNNPAMKRRKTEATIPGKGDRFARKTKRPGLDLSPGRLLISPPPSAAQEPLYVWPQLR